MKRFSEIVKILSVLLGSVVGAGFLSGAELAVFFGTNDFVPFLFVSGFLFFMGFFVVYLSEKQTTTQKSKTKFFEFGLLISCAIFSSAMLAGINDLFIFCGVMRFIPSFACLIVFLFCSEKDVSFMEKTNGIIMSTTIVFTIIFILCANTTEPAGHASQKEANIIFPILFSFLNIFITIPVIKDTIKNKSGFSVVMSFALFSAIFIVFASIILTAIKNSGSVDYSLPLLNVFYGNKIIYCIFGVCIFLCSFTSFYTCCFPLSKKVCARFGKRGIIVLVLFVYLFSLTGLERIIKSVYPLFGALGAVYVCRAFLFLFKGKSGIKESIKADNKIKEKNGGTSMSKRKKNKVKKLTDEEYSNYIMSLKDEKPPLLIRKTQS